MTHSIRILILLSSAFLIAACGTPVRHQVEIDQAPDQPIAGPLAVSVDNQAGSVTVAVDERLDAPVVLARGRFGTVSTDLAQTGGGAFVRALYDQGSGPGVLRIETIRPDSTPSDLLVDILVRVPRCDGVRVRNAGGPVEIVGSGGAIDIHNGAHTDAPGKVLLKTDQALHDPVTLRTDSGDIYCAIGHGSSGALSARTGMGEVLVRSPNARITNASAQRSEWVGTVNAGEAPLTLATGKGNVYVAIVQGPERPWMGYFPNSNINEIPDQQILSKGFWSPARNY